MLLLSLVPRRARPRKTVEDYMSLPEGVRAELIDGELIVSPSPKRPHQRVVGRIFNKLTQIVEERGLGEVFVSPFDVHLPSGDIVEPDVLFIAKPNLGIVKDWVRGTPDLVVEVVSPEGVVRDRMLKRELYARNGVREYWIVDPNEQMIEVLLLSGAEFEPSGYFSKEDMLESTVLSELKLPLASIFDE